MRHQHSPSYNANPLTSIPVLHCSNSQINRYDFTLLHKVFVPSGDIEQQIGNCSTTIDLLVVSEWLVPVSRSDRGSFGPGAVQTWNVGEESKNPVVGLSQRDKVKLTSSLHQSPVGALMDHLALDIMGPLPTEEDHLYIVVMTDYFTEWSEPYALIDQATQDCRWIPHVADVNTIRSVRAGQVLMASHMRQITSRPQ